MARRLPLEVDDDRLQVQYLEPLQLTTPAEGAAPAPQPLVPPGFTPLPFYRSPEGDQLIEAPTEPSQDNLPLNQAMSDIMAGRAPTKAQQDLIDSFVDQLIVPNKASGGKEGTADQGLNFYSKIPGQVEFVNGSVWIHDETNQETPWRHFTRDHAFDPRTGQLYETRSAGEEAQAPPLAGTAAEIGPRAAHVARSVVTDPVVAFGRTVERAYHGLVVPRQVEIQEASAVAGGITSGGAVPRVTRELTQELATPGAPPRAPTLGMSGADGQGGFVRRALNAMGRALTGRRAAEPAAPAAVAPEPTAPRTSQYRNRPVPEGLTPQGHITPAMQARQAAERQARIDAARPDVDEAGFYVHALERARRDLPETATAAEMRDTLRQLGVEDAEATMLGLDQFLLGEVGAARAALRQGEQDLGRVGSQYGNALSRARKNPGNTHYAEEVTRLGREITEGRDRIRELQRGVQSAERQHVQTAYQNFRNAEAHLKTVNKQIAEGKGQLSGGELAELYQDRIAARRQLAADRTALAEARSADPGTRTVTRQELVAHLQQARPRLAFEVREFPKDPYGLMTGPIRTIQHRATTDPNPFEAQMIRRGIDLRTASDIATAMSTMAPTTWGQHAAALANHMRNPNVIREALEEAAGASIADMAQAWRGSTGRHNPEGPRPPRYRMSVPDSGNPTMREVAVILRGPWDERRRVNIEANKVAADRDRAYTVYTNEPKGSAAERIAEAEYNRLEARFRELIAARDALPKPPFVSGHWSSDTSPVGHMQVTIQRAPVQATPREVRQIDRMSRSIDAMQAERTTIARRLEELGEVDAPTRAMEAEEQRLMHRDSQLDRDITRARSQIPQGQASDDTIYMGNQFQSDWSGAGSEGFRTPFGEQLLQGNRAIRDDLVRQRAALDRQMRQIMSEASNRGTPASRGDILSRGGSILTPEETRRFDVLEARSHDLYSDIQRLEMEMSNLEHRPAHHSLVANTKAWLRPMLEQFIEQGIRSGSRYLGVPSGATVNTHNPISAGTMRLYDETLRKELRHVMERRGLRYNEASIRTMYSPDGDPFHGQWYLIELPRGRTPSPGVRLMQRGGVPQAPQQQEEE